MNNQKVQNIGTILWVTVYPQLRQHTWIRSQSGCILAFQPSHPPFWSSFWSSSWWFSKCSWSSLWVRWTWSKSKANHMRHPFQSLESVTVTIYLYLVPSLIPPHHLVTLSPCHPTTLSPFHSYHHNTTPPHHPIILYHPDTLSPFRLITPSLLSPPHLILVLALTSSSSLYTPEYSLSWTLYLSPLIPVLCQLLSWSSCTISISPSISILVLDP